MNLPNTIQTLDELEDLLSKPTQQVMDFTSTLDGDVIVLGAAGKMGFSLSRMLKRALTEAGKTNRVIAVSRFSNPASINEFQDAGIETIACDLLEREAIHRLPKSEQVIFMAGKKFGSTGDEWNTWAMNTHVPAMVADYFKDSNIAAFSTGNVYPFVPPGSGGCKEETMPHPVGEYAQSCLGRERMFEYFSRQNNTPCVLLRLNYAVEMRYGVLLDIAQKVYSGIPIDLHVGYANVIWQGDANAYAILSLQLCKSPVEFLNMTGEETLSVRKLAEQFGEILNKQPVFEKEESETALLNNAEKCFERFGKPSIPISTVMEWIADWVKRDMPTLNKPTHYEVKTGKF